MTTFKEKIVGAVNYMTNFFVSCYLLHIKAVLLRNRLDPAF